VRAFLFASLPGQAWLSQISKSVMGLGTSPVTRDRGPPANGRRRLFGQDFAEFLEGLVVFRGGLGAVARPQLLQDAAHVVLDGKGLVAADLGVGLALAHPVEDLVLARAEIEPVTAVG
jgi:hypothetical protein